MSVTQALGALFALVLLVGLGRAVVSLVVRETTLLPAETWALSFIIGAAAISLLAFVLSPLFGAVPAVPLLTGVVAVTCGLAALRRGHRGPSTSGSPAPRDAVVIPLRCAIAIQWGLLFLGAVLTPLTWDGLFNFEMKARLALTHDPSGQLPLAYFSDSSRLWSHPGYPLLLPLTEFWMYAWIGQPHQVLVKLLFPLFYLSLAGLLYGAIRRRASEWFALAGCLALGLVPSFTFPGGVAGGFADVALAAASFGALALAQLALTTGAWDAALVAGLLSGAAVWTKREGMVLATYVILGAWAWKWQERREINRAWMIALRGAAPLALAPFSVAVLWLVFQHLHGVPEADFARVTPAVVFGNASSLPVIAAQFSQELLNRPHWGFLWPAFALTLTLLARRGLGGSETLFLGAIAVPVGAYAAVFLCSSWPSLTDHIQSAFPRLLIPLAPVALLLMLSAIWDCLFRPLEPRDLPATHVHERQSS